MGFENTFDIERFKRDFRVEVQTLTEEEAVFDLIGIDAALANAFRRILLAEVPTMAIEKVFILNNTSMIQDEVLAQRLGLIPIRADPRKFNARNADDDADADNVISFRLQGDQDERFADDPIRPVHDDILIARLRPGQEIELEAWCEKGLGKTHAKWSPVCTASYRLLPDIRLKEPITGDDAHKLKGMCPMDVFDVEDLGGVPTAKTARPRNCSMCRECVRQPSWEKRVELARVKDHFIFSVESTGSLPPEILFQEAVKVLMQKAIDIAGLLNDAVAGQAGGGAV